MRNCAAYQLGQLGDPASVEPLLEALDRSHLIGAGEALARFREPRAIPPLVECLGDAFVRERAAAALLEFGRAAVGALTAALDRRELKLGTETRRSVERRSACARLLRAIKDPRAEPALGDRLDDPAREVRRSAAIALAQVAPDASIPERVRVLIEALSDAVLSEECAEALMVTPEEATPPLVDALNVEARALATRDGRVPSRTLRSMARAMARMGEPEVRALPELACHQNALVRGLSVAHLARMRAPTALPVVIAALRDPDARVRRTAAACARRMGLSTQTSGVVARARGVLRAWRIRLAGFLPR